MKLVETFPLSPAEKYKSHSFFTDHSGKSCTFATDAFPKVPIW